MTYHIFPSALALALKIYILFVARKSQHKIDFFVPLLLILAFHNLAEFSAFIFFLSESVTVNAFKTYYSATFAMVCFIAIYSMKVSATEHNKILTNVFYAFCLILSAAVYFTGWIVSGAENIGYALTAIKGEYYVVFQLFVVLALVYSLVVLFRGYSNSESSDVKANCLISIVALSPIILTLVVIIALMAVGIKITAAGFLPISTSLFLYILIKYEAQHRITDIRRWVPYSQERKLTNELMKLSSLYSMDKIGYKDMLAEFEKLSIEYKYHESGGNISEAARRMKLKRTTLYSMIDRTGMKEKLLDKH